MSKIANDREPSLTMQELKLYDPLCFLTDNDCETSFSCGANGHCMMNNDGSNRCLCDDDRWNSEPDCSVETCSSSGECRNGGSCVRYVYTVRMRRR